LPKMTFPPEVPEATRIIVPVVSEHVSNSTRMGVAGGAVVVGAVVVVVVVVCSPLVERAMMLEASFSTAGVPLLRYAAKPVVPASNTMAPELVSRSTLFCLKAIPRSNTGLDESIDASDGG
jgi:hypothetical protein